MKPTGSVSDAALDAFDLDRMKQARPLGTRGGAPLSLVDGGLRRGAPWSHNCAPQEILEEVVRELHRVKEEIIDGEAMHPSTPPHLWAAGRATPHCPVPPNQLTSDLHPPFRCVARGKGRARQAVSEARDSQGQLRACWGPEQARPTHLSQPALPWSCSPFPVWPVQFPALCR